MMKVNIPEGQIGEWKVERFLVDRLDYHALPKGRGVPKGETFTRLKRGGTLVMSDTPAEQMDHYEIIYKAKGNVLLAGLGIGMVLDAVAKKDEVTHVTVVEVAKEVIDLVWPHYKSLYGDKIEVVNESILTWKPQTDAYYDCAWYDIWDNICLDNLSDMTKLHRKFAKKTGWQGSWARDQLRRR